MRARSFLIGLTITIFALILLSFGLWKTAKYKSPLNLNNEPIAMPLAAKFFPKETYFTIHLKLDPNNLPKYIEANVPETKRRRAKEKSIKLRNGIFAIMGLNYEKDILNKFDSIISFSIFNPLEEQNNKRWVLVLQAKNSDNSEILKDYWARKESRGAEILKEINEDIEIKYSKDEKIGEYKEIATAFTKSNQFLIASDINTLKESLKIYQNSEQSQFYDDDIIKAIPKLNNGISLLTASKEALGSWFNFSNNITKRNDLNKFVGSLEVNNSDLLLNGILNFDDRVMLIKNQQNEDISLVSELKLGDDIEDISILNEPSKLLSQTSKDPISQLIGPFLNQYLNNVNTVTSKRIIEIENDEMIFAKNQDDWIIGSKKNNQKEKINELLAKENFSNEVLNTERGSIEIWSKLKLNDLKKYQEITKEIIFILDETSELNWWSNQFKLIEKRSKGISFYPEENRFLTSKTKNWQGISQAISLGSISAKEQLEKWKPWILIERIIGEPLEKNIKGLEIEIGNNEYENNSELNLLARLSLG